MDNRVLVVDDDRLIRQLTHDSLSQEGFRVTLASSGVEALDLLASDGPFDIVVTDLSMREMDGLELLDRIKREEPQMDVVIMTGYASLESALQAMRLGAADYLRKPVTGPEISYCVKRTLLRRRLADENESLRGCIKAFEASRPLASCLESSDVLPLTLDICLNLVGRSRAVGRLHQVGAQPGDGVYLQGFPVGVVPGLRADIEQGKLFDPADFGSLSTSGSGLDEALVSRGLEDENLLGVPLRFEGNIVGGIWIFSDGRSFREDELRNLELVAGQAELALLNSERFVQAREKAFVDDVTELYNARYLLSALDREVNRASRTDRELSVLFLDLDRFKLVNDRYGHLVGSRVLRELGGLLHASIRSIDTVARYGGDEFTAVLVDTGMDGAMQVAERILETVSSTPFGADRGLQLSLTVSIGVATFPMHGQARESLLDQADKAMYMAKALGRNQICTANELSQPRMVGSDPEG